MLDGGGQDFLQCIPLHVADAYTLPGEVEVQGASIIKSITSSCLNDSQVLHTRLCNFDVQMHNSICARNIACRAK